MLITSKTWWRSVRGQDPPKFSIMTSLRDREKMNCGRKGALFVISSLRGQESSGETWDHLGCSEQCYMCYDSVAMCPHPASTLASPSRATTELPVHISSAQNLSRKTATWTSSPSPGGGSIMATPQKQHGFKSIALNPGFPS